MTLDAALRVIGVFALERKLSGFRPTPQPSIRIGQVDIGDFQYRLGCASTRSGRYCRECFVDRETPLTSSWSIDTVGLLTINWASEFRPSLALARDGSCWSTATRRFRTIECYMSEIWRQARLFGRSDKLAWL